MDADSNPPAPTQTIDGNGDLIDFPEQNVISSHEVKRFNSTLTLMLHKQYPYYTQYGVDRRIKEFWQWFHLGSNEV